MHIIALVLISDAHFDMYNTIAYTLQGHEHICIFSQLCYIDGFQYEPIKKSIRK